MDRLQIAVERFHELTSDKGLTPTPPKDPQAVTDLVTHLIAEVAPLQIPEELVWLWQTFDGRESFGSLAGGLGWRFDKELQCFFMKDDDGFMPHPKPLLPIANGEHWWYFIDLSGDELVAPGAIFEWCFTTVEYEMVALDIADVFHASSDAIELGEASDQGPYWLLDDGPNFAARLRLAGATEEQTRSIPIEILDWPQRWRDAEGITDEQIAPRGATHTIADFVEARHNGPVSGTIIAGRAGGGFGSGNGSRLFIQDETGELEVTIPSTVVQYGEKESGRFEYDITAIRWTGPEPTIRDLGSATAEVQRLALEGRVGDASAAAPNPHPYIDGPQPVTVTAIRPL